MHLLKQMPQARHYRLFFKETDTYSVTDSVPFSSRRKFMGIQTKDKCFLLGAPDYLTKDDEILKKQPLTPMKDFVYSSLGSCQKLYKDAKEIEEFTPLSLIVLSDCVKRMHSIHSPFCKTRCSSQSHFRRRSGYCFIHCGTCRNTGGGRIYRCRNTSG